VEAIGETDVAGDFAVHSTEEAGAVMLRGRGGDVFAGSLIM
jgi:hypothetical protein